MDIFFGKCRAPVYFHLSHYNLGCGQLHLVKYTEIQLTSLYPYVAFEKSHCLYDFTLMRGNSADEIPGCRIKVTLGNALFYSEDP